MSKIDDRTRLLHMRDAARELATFIQGKTRESLENDRRRFRAFTCITRRSDRKRNIGLN